MSPDDDDHQFWDRLGGIRKFFTFADALTLTYNATSLKLPGAASITTAAGDKALFESLGSGNWQCLAYQKASGLPVVSLFSTSDGTVFPVDQLFI